MAVLDTFDRPLRNLRLSVTDRCNLRCSYCMPEEEYVWLPREDILDFEEVSRLVDVFASLGVTKVRLTGGEPLLRRDLASLVEMLAAKPSLTDIALTTNGILLPDQADTLKRAGLHRVTVSLDTLDRVRFKALTRFDWLDKVLAGIDAASRAFGGLKLDAVVMRGVNDDELVALVEYGKRLRAEVRFIEYMDVGGATHWSMDKVVSRAAMLERLTSHYGGIQPIIERTSAPAARFTLPDGTTFGIISSTTEPFCRDCDRSRVTADGRWYLCLYATTGVDLQAMIRRGASNEDIRSEITNRWRARQDRGAEQRLDVHHRAPLIPIGRLKKDPHLEMHTRGG